MYKIFLSIMLSLISLNLWSKSPIINVTPKEGLEIIRKEGKSLLIIDIRTPEEYASGYIKGATNINFNSADFEQNISKLTTTNAIFVYCRSGNRSTQSLSIFLKYNFIKIYHLKNGINGWSSAKYPLEQIKE